MIRIALPLLAVPALLLVAPVTHAQNENAWVADRLRDYAAGQHEAVAQELQKVGSVSRLETDLEALSKKWLKQEPVDARRRELAAFALEAGFALALQGPAAAKLVEWGCKHIRSITRPGEFERRWHLAAFAALGGAIDPDRLESHVVHMKMHLRSSFPEEPRLAFERALASELRAADVYTKRKVAPGRGSPSEIAERNEEAAKRYREATAASEPAVQAEAWLRLGRVELVRGKLDEAVAALDRADATLTDPALRYLARVFRGMALERLKQPDEARQAFQSALAINPRGHAATTALATLLFRIGERLEADRLVSALVANPVPFDPWWVYWPGDYRHGTRLILDMRQALK
jgi:tetratricopeptide (TPR) repeat protein